MTGGIGAGKSAVAQRLAGQGAVLIDADVLAREVVAPGTPGLAEIAAAFGDEVLTAGGELDRPALGARVFGDDDARRRLEKIIHPRVRARTAELTPSQATTKAARTVSGASCPATRNLRLTPSPSCSSPRHCRPVTTLSGPSRSSTA